MTKIETSYLQVIGFHLCLVHLLSFNTSSLNSCYDDSFGRGGIQGKGKALPQTPWCF